MSNLDLGRVLVGRVRGEDSQYVCDAAGDEELDVPGLVAEEVLVGQVDG